MITFQIPSIFFFSQISDISSATNKGASRVNIRQCFLSYTAMEKAVGPGGAALPFVELKQAVENKPGTRKEAGNTQVRYRAFPPEVQQRRPKATFTCVDCWCHVRGKKSSGCRSRTCSCEVCVTGLPTRLANNLLQLSFLQPWVTSSCQTHSLNCWTSTSFVLLFLFRLFLFFRICKFDKAS